MSSRSIPLAPVVLSLAREPELRPAWRDPTSLSSWGLAMARALEAHGCDAAALFAQVGLDFAALDDPEARYPQRGTSELWRLSVEATGDPCFGLAVARHTSPTTFHALGLSLAASGSLREAFERVVRYYRLVSDGATIRFEDRGSVYRVSVRPAGDHPALEAVDAVLAVAVRLCRSLTNRKFSPLRVEVRRPAPADPSPFFRCFRAPVMFDSPEDALVLDKVDGDRRIRGANPELARANDLVAAQAIDRWDRARLADRVRVVLADRLPSGAPLLSEMARALGTSTRALQRRLATESTTYAQLVDDARRDLADAYVREGRHSMGEIAYLLGFSGAASFTRAFRRWRGLAPSEARARKIRI
jgi:AraC-like DNA-binding protein